MRRSFYLYAVAAAISLCTAADARAAVCASTFGADSSFGGPLYLAQGSGAGAKIEWAFPFTPSIDCQLGSSEVAFHLESGTNGLRISVVDDASGLPGSTVVESTTVVGQMTTDSAGSIVMGLFSGANLLSGSSTYWIVVEAEPGAGDTTAIWHASPDVLGPRASRTNDGSWLAQTLNFHGAFRVTEPVPVPAMSIWGHAVLGCALALSAGLFARRRSRSLQTASRDPGLGA